MGWITPLPKRIDQIGGIIKHSQEKNEGAILREQALEHLTMALKNPTATFREGQWESIEQLLKQKRVLVVQRTGWGKSMVYFLATKLLRDQGSGPTLLISPLLSLMRNQLEAAQRLGLTARAINSTNPDAWEPIQNELASDGVDILLISPERLANQSFRQDILATFAHRIGLFVIDEAHCISDWGHDFRPDYRRIVRVLKTIPPNIPVLATTATANNRVVNDVEKQLGQNLLLQRGSLVRKSLKLQNIHMPSPAARMAWLAQTIPNLPGSGIVYTLTQRDAERVAEWLRINHIEAEAYHAGVSDLDTGHSQREALEQKLLSNDLKVLVATVALGMGFDKPDLGFVIHYQRPASVVHYYQQVGRAGRAVDEAFGILLSGEEDDPIADFFIRSAFPPQQHISQILNALEQADTGLSVPELQRSLNLQHGQITKTLKYLTVESPSPVTKQQTKWFLTATAATYQPNEALVQEITELRQTEQHQMREYVQHSSCLMAFLQRALDDSFPETCGQCFNCNPELLLDASFDTRLANRAGLFLRRSYQPLLPRKQWPLKDMFQKSPLGDFRISPSLQPKEGRALCLWRDAGWGQQVAQGKYHSGRFADELVAACVEMLRAWAPDPKPQWVTCIPSLTHPELVPNFTHRLADTLELPFVPCIRKIITNQQQKCMVNSFHQVRNLDGVFEITDSFRADACLLVDDVVDSGWTLTVASALLLQAGSGPVFPLALALNSPRME